MQANEARLQAFGSVKAKSVMAMVKRSRERGYVVTEDIVVRGVSAISLPFGNRNGVPSAAISVACVPMRMPQSRHPELVALLKSEIRNPEEILRASSQIISKVA